MSDAQILEFIAERIDRLEEELKSDLKDQRDKIYEIHGEVSGLRVRASIFGGLSGLFGGAIGTLLSLVGAAKSG